MSKLIKDKNDLATIYPDLSKEWNYEKNGNLTPHNITSGSRKKVWWLCEHGHTYEQLICKRVEDILVHTALGTRY